ncbi:sialidase family protein [Actinacidiphila bryophytorum]|uniref:sialidase family protein n=1 Tax=Actinacidiphila bryophytorum TaxID=1436133 RepID=UPI001960E3DA|nr:sialidase family protein [Actinacidiphila bryophytorum]MBM9438485.1 exo-alpha-sialidase [Actinacidiphila bryophytorum]
MALSVGGAVSAAAAPIGPGPGPAPDEVPFGPVTVADPGSGASYARAVRLGEQRPGGPRTLLATFQQFDSGQPGGFPVFRSDDGGRTWRPQSKVPDGGESGRIWLQPFLYELPRAFAGLPKGTVLCAANSLDSASTRIVLYASLDRGLTWRFLSTVTEGGPPVPQNGNTPVWEPFLLLHRDRLVCYYSDQRDPAFGQKLAHQTSRDLRHWGEVVDDAVGEEYSKRPGMITVAQVRRDLWIMSYEYGVTDTYYPVRYKLARDPESFGPAPALELLDQDGYAPSAAPTVAWSDSGGPQGTIVLSANSDQDFFVNRALGDPAQWTRLSSPMPRGYSRFTIPLTDPGPRHRSGLVFVVTGAPYAEQAPIQAGVISLD